MEVFVGIGSNLGHRFDHIRRALRLLAKDVSEMRVSIVLETKAIVPAGAPETWDLPYFNLVVLANTTLSPSSFLKRLKQIEAELGRDFTASRWAPRIIDLDILAWGEEIISQEGLTVPHSQLMHRPFFLNLMASLRSDWRYPVSGFSYSHLTLAEILHTQIKFDPAESRCFMAFPQLLGIVNVTSDSFSDGGKYLDTEKALQKIRDLTSQGAAVIDIGAQSTRPGSTRLSAEAEWTRLEPVFERLAKDVRTLGARPQISLDSYHPEVVQKVLRRYPLDWINDVTGVEDERLLKIAVESRCKIVLNHSLTVAPLEKVILPFEKRPLSYLYNWAEKKIAQLSALGVSQDRIILDPGIGFGKTVFQSLALLRDIAELKKLGCEILVGHSRKSFLKIISSTVASERDLETVGSSHYLSRKGVDYLRVHNVEAHQKSLTAAALLEGGTLENP